MKVQFFSTRITIFGLLLAVFIAAISIKFFVLPALEIYQKPSLVMLKGGVEVVKPFWPQYWRHIRNLAEAKTKDEIFISDDGGILIITSSVALVSGLLAYKYRRYLIKRI